MERSRILGALLCLAFLTSCGFSQADSILYEDQQVSVSEQEINDYDFNALLAKTNESMIAFGTAELQAAGHVFKCMREANTSEKLAFITDGLKGMVIDGAGGDIAMIRDGVYYAGKESLRAAMSSTVVGRWILRSRGSRTTEEVVAQAAQKTWEFSTKVKAFVDQHGADMATYTYRMSTDVAYRHGQALKIYSAILVSMIPLMDAVSDASCQSVRTEVARIMGMVSYEISLTVGLAIITAEAAGTGGAVKLGSVIAKLTRMARTATTRVSRFISRIVDGLKDFARRLIQMTKRSRYADDVLENGTDVIRQAENVGDLRYVDDAAELVGCAYRALSLLDVGDVCKLSYASNAAQKSITKKAAKNHKIRQWWERVSRLLRQGKKAPYEHRLTGEYAGKFAASVDNGSPGKGGLRLIFERTETDVIIHGMLDYH